MSAPYDDGSKETIFEMGRESALDEVREAKQVIINDIMELHADLMYTPAPDAAGEAQNRLADIVAKLEDL